MGKSLSDSRQHLRASSYTQFAIRRGLASLSHSTHSFQHCTDLDVWSLQARAWLIKDQNGVVSSSVVERPLVWLLTLLVFLGCSYCPLLSRCRA